MSQLVDPFSPVHPPNLQTGQPTSRPAMPRNRLNSPTAVPIGTIRHVASNKQSTLQTFGSSSRNFRDNAKPTHAVAGSTALAKVTAGLRIPVFIIIALAFSYLLQSLILGGIAVGLYAIYVIVKRVPSKISFQLSIIALIGIVALIGLGTDAQLVSNFAIYTLLLMIIGTISLTWESD